MNGRKRFLFRALRGLGLSALFLHLAGCGMDRLQPTLPNAIPNFTLADLKQIQNDSALTTQEKRDAIRAAVGAPDDPSGDRLVEFLLNFTVP